MQKLLVDNADLSQEHKIYFPMNFGGGNCSELVAAFKSDYSIFWGHLGLTPVQALERRNSICAEFQSILSTLPSDATVVLSSEHFSSQLVGRTEIIRLHHFLEKIFTEIKVLIFLKDQASLAEGRTWETLKNGAIRFQWAEPSSEELFLPYFNYKRLLLNWIEVFGKENLIVRNFGRLLLDKQDIGLCLETEIKRIASSDSFKFETQTSFSNVSPGLFSYETTRQVNKLLLRKVVLENQEYPYSPNYFFSTERENLVNRIRELDVYNRKYRVNREAWFKRFQEVNLWVQSEFSDIGELFLLSQLPNDETTDLEEILAISKKTAYDLAPFAVGSNLELKEKPRDT